MQGAFLFTPFCKCLVHFLLCSSGFEAVVLSSGSVRIRIFDYAQSASACKQAGLATHTELMLEPSHALETICTVLYGKVQHDSLLCSNEGGHLHRRC